MAAAAAGATAAGAGTSIAVRRLERIGKREREYLPRVERAGRQRRLAAGAAVSRWDSVSLRRRLRVGAGGGVAPAIGSMSAVVLFKTAALESRQLQIGSNGGGVWTVPVGI